MNLADKKRIAKRRAKEAYNRKRLELDKFGREAVPAMLQDVNGKTICVSKHKPGDIIAVSLASELEFDRLIADGVFPYAVTIAGRDKLRNVIYYRARESKASAA